VPLAPTTYIPQGVVASRHRSAGAQAVAPRHRSAGALPVVAAHQPLPGVRCTRPEHSASTRLRCLARCRTASAASVVAPSARGQGRSAAVCLPPPYPHHQGGRRSHEERIVGQGFRAGHRGADPRGQNRQVNGRVTANLYTFWVYRCRRLGRLIPHWGRGWAIFLATTTHALRMPCACLAHASIAGRNERPAHVCSAPVPHPQGTHTGHPATHRAPSKNNPRGKRAGGGAVGERDPRQDYPGAAWWSDGDHWRVSAGHCSTVPRRLPRSVVGWGGFAATAR